MHIDHIQRILPQDFQKLLIMRRDLRPLHQYAIDENTMMRYARRKGAVKKLEDALQEGKGDMII